MVQPTASMPGGLRIATLPVLLQSRCLSQSCPKSRLSPVYPGREKSFHYKTSFSPGSTSAVKLFTDRHGHEGPKLTSNVGPKAKYKPKNNKHTTLPVVKRQLAGKKLLRRMEVLTVRATPTAHIRKPYRFRPFRQANTPESIVIDLTKSLFVRPVNDTAIFQDWSATQIIDAYDLLPPPPQTDSDPKIHTKGIPSLHKVGNIPDERKESSMVPTAKKNFNGEAEHCNTVPPLNPPKSVPKADIYKTARLTTLPNLSKSEIIQQEHNSKRDAYGLLSPPCHIEPAIASKANAITTSGQAKKQPTIIASLVSRLENLFKSSINHEPQSQQQFVLAKDSRMFRSGFDTTFQNKSQELESDTSTRKVASSHLPIRPVSVSSTDYSAEGKENNSENLVRIVKARNYRQVMSRYAAASEKVQSGPEPITSQHHKLPSLYSQLFGSEWLIGASGKKTKRKSLKQPINPIEPGQESIFKLLFPDDKEIMPEAADEDESLQNVLVDPRVDVSAFLGPDANPSTVAKTKAEYWVLRGTSWNLAPSDFKRLVRGEHISKWEANIEMFQAYNHMTYAPLDQYIIRFRNPAEAAAFRIAFDAPDTRRNRSFTLIPPNGEKRPLSLQRCTYDTHGFDFSGAVRRRLSSPHAVHLCLGDEVRMISEIKHFLAWDGEERGSLPWAIATGVDPRLLETERKGDKVLYKRRLRPGVIALAPRDEVGGEFHFEDRDSKDAEDPGSGYFTDFAIGFDTECEARSFARRWHRRYTIIGAAENEVQIRARVLSGFAWQGDHVRFRARKAILKKKTDPITRWRLQRAARASGILRL